MKNPMRRFIKTLHVSHSADFALPLQLSTEVPGHKDANHGPYETIRQV